MTIEALRDHFIEWVRQNSDMDPGQLNPLVTACLDDAVENTHAAFTKVPDLADPEQSKALMKQVLDYWCSNVYIIIERGIASDNFRGVKMPIPTSEKRIALRDFYSIRNSCYASYFN
jgi:hypothetical protein